MHAHSGTRAHETTRLGAKATMRSPEVNEITSVPVLTINSLKLKQRQPVIGSKFAEQNVSRVSIYVNGFDINLYVVRFEVVVH